MLLFTIQMFFLVLAFFFFLFILFLLSKAFQFAFKVIKNSVKIYYQKKNLIKGKRIRVKPFITPWLKKIVRLYKISSKKVERARLLLEKVGKIIAKEIFIEE